MVVKIPGGIFTVPNIGGGGTDSLLEMWESDNIWFVDGDDGSTSNSGTQPDESLTLVSDAVSNASANATIYVKPRVTTASAQSYYLDTITIPKTKPNISIIGAGYEGCTQSQSGVQFKAATASVGDHLINVLGAGLYLKNMRLTLSNGTADAGKCIVNAETSATSSPAGLTIRGCRFENHYSHPGYGTSNLSAAVGLCSARHVTIENCFFFDCQGGIVFWDGYGVGTNLTVKNNIFGGSTANRDCDILLNLAAAHSMNIIGNVFSDGKPAHSGGSYGYFIYITGATATGCVGGNLFSTGTENSIIDATGTDCIIPTTFFCPCNFYEGTGTTAPYGLATAV